VSIRLKSSPLHAALAALALLLAAGTVPVHAQDFFIPGQPRAPATAPRPARPPQRPAAPPRQTETAQPQNLPQPSDDNTDAATAAAQMQLPPPVELPALPKAPPPPAAVIGVIGVPEVMRASASAQMVERTISGRRQKLAEDAQKEQSTWREMQQSLVNDRPKLNAEQVRVRERELQERITNAQREFRERGRIIQDAAQYALAQIERTLVQVIRQVAEAHGMNLVLHRAQVALNTQEFDITEQVADQLNKVTPTVIIPPEGQEPPMQPATAANAPTPATPQSATPAAAPATSAPATPAPATP